MGEPLLNQPRSLHWCILLILSIIFLSLLKMAGLPAALMLGPMIAGIVVESAGGKVRVPIWPFRFGQAVIGCLVAHAITADIMSSFFHRWPLFMGVVLAVIVASSLLGYGLSRFKILPGTTAIWGLLPGAASVMVLMAEDFGADMRLVAFMQYLRVVFVAIAAAVIARALVHVTGDTQSTIWFPQIHWLAFGETLLIVLVGMLFGDRSPIPAGSVLLPMIIGAVLQVSGMIQIELPYWFLALSYLLVGWNIGLRFTRSTIIHAVRALPQIIVAILIIMGFCWALSYLLMHELNIDPLTAYLATSPGGLDSVAIIAASTNVDMPFVMSLQVVRLILVLMIGPPLSRCIARLIPGANPL